jgi:phosphatidylethanolamine/phosphatidyl-N-methylethanolamine N-methyltransferase
MKDFYNSNYRELFYSKGISSWATSRIHKALEKKFPTNKGMKILEVGGGEGFHVPYVRPDFEKYTVLDIQERDLDLEASNLSKAGKLTQIVADACNLPFEDKAFDRVIFMCVLHHLERIDLALSEARRVVKDKGCISIYLPCDPGLIYRFLRRIFTSRRSRNIGLNYEVINAFEHRNHILSLVLIIKSLFGRDKVGVTWRPFPLRSWNINLFCIVVIQKDASVKP